MENFQYHPVKLVAPRMDTPAQGWTLCGLYTSDEEENRRPFIGQSFWG